MRDTHLRSAHILARLLDRCRTVLWVAALISLPAPAGFDVAECGDTIYFKDGMRTECQSRAWEEKDEVRCEYGGGLLIYPKSDVSHIEKGPAVEEEAALKKDREQALNPPPRTTPALSRKPAPPTSSLKSSPGILFYDPRRPKKYWSSATGHHDSYREAIAALAAEFDRPTQWIEENMGDTNDLEEVRANLSASKQAPTPAAPGSPPDAEGAGITFYNPRRPQKYWTAEDARHNTFAEAVAAFAREFEEPASWIEAHMGDSNDLGSIRRALREAQHAEKDKENGDSWQ
jgi:hypothetical protein